MIFQWFVPFVLAWIIVFPASGQQEYIHISGIVQDKNMGERLPLASIHIAGTGLGTVSNQQGEFEFNIPEASGADTLIISYVGYKDIKKIVSDAATGRLEYFLLEESVTELSQVVVVDGQSYAEGIVNKAISNMKEVFPVDEFILDAFYREWEIRQLVQKDNRDRASMVEAAIRIMDKGFNMKSSRSLKEAVYLIELRKIKATGESVEGTEFGWLLMQNPVNYPKGKSHFFVPGALDMPNDLEYEYIKRVSFEGEELHVISVEVPAFLSTYTLYLSTRDYALLRVDLKAQSQGGQFVHHDPADPRYRVLFIDNTLRFRRVGNKPYISYMRMHWEWEKCDSLEGRLEEGENYKELVVNHVFTARATVAAMKNQMKTPPVKAGESLYAKATPYNAAFWQHYNVLKDNPLNTRLQHALETSDKTLEENFEGHE